MEQLCLSEDLIRLRNEGVVFSLAGGRHLSVDGVPYLNQQKVLKAIFKKITTSDALLMNYPEILKAVEKDMQTDMPMSMISALVRNQLDTGDEWDIKRQQVKGKMDQKGTWSMGPLRPLDVCIINEESLKNCADRINELAED